MNGAYDAATGSDAEDEDFASTKEFYRAAMQRGKKELLASPPFLPGSDARRLYSEYISRIPVVGQVYSAYTALRGYDPVAGDCLSTWDRIGNGLSAVPTIPHGGRTRSTEIRNVEYWTEPLI